MHCLASFPSSSFPRPHSPQELQCHHAPATSTTGRINDRTMGLARTNIPPGWTLGLWPGWRRLFGIQGRALDRRKGYPGYGGETGLQDCLSACLSICIAEKKIRLKPHPLWLLVDFTVEETSPVVQMLPRARPYVPQMIENWPQELKSTWLSRKHLITSIDDSVTYRESFMEKCGPRLLFLGRGARICPPCLTATLSLFCR